jgi:hypothetical protein
VYSQRVTPGSDLVLATLFFVASPKATGPLDYGAQARELSSVVACAPGAARPGRFDDKVMTAHCRDLATLQTRWKQRWLTRAQPFLQEVVPVDLPPRVVYPFGGGDLLTALVSFPGAIEISTLSLEPAGDPRSIDNIAPAELEAALADVRAMAGHLFAVAHSKTSSMSQMARAKLPGELTSALVALAMNDYEPVSLKYFSVDPDGQLHYLSPADLGSAGGPQTRLFANMELEFQPRGGGMRHVFRHFAANLDDRHLSADPAVLRHLEAKGEVTAITKAASYLLWWDEFSQIRSYLLGHMVWMISDSTGIPADKARSAGFEQIPYGHFEGPFLNAGRRQSEDFQKLWADGARPLSFRFGYPDNAGNSHLLITRHPEK